jgi:hypothetical protein
MRQQKGLGLDRSGQEEEARRGTSGNTQQALRKVIHYYLLTMIVY